MKFWCFYTKERKTEKNGLFFFFLYASENFEGIYSFLSLPLLICCTLWALLAVLNQKFIYYYFAVPDLLIEKYLK